ncbi:peptide deformylase [Streptosporangium carneum]|uniref:peptide deformylase n=1 Tax=Streptosporangium carneum TaxID=47481 RepID=UPI0034D97EE8
MVPRPLRIEVSTADLDGAWVATTFEHGLARLVAHEIDHLSQDLHEPRRRRIPLRHLRPPVAVIVGVRRHQRRHVRLLTLTWRQAAQSVPWRTTGPWDAWPS